MPTDSDHIEPSNTDLCFENNLGCCGSCWDLETFLRSNLLPWSAVEDSPPVLRCVQTVGLVLECPEPSVTIKGCADTAAVLLSGDGLTVKFPNAHSPPIHSSPAPRFTVYGHLCSASSSHSAVSDVCLKLGGGHGVHFNALKCKFRSGWSHVQRAERR